MGTIYKDEQEARATRTEFLERRIEINKAYSSADFDQWLFGKLNVREGEDILDVGCGSGAQTVPFAKKVGEKGSVSSLDIAEDSIELLKSRVGNANNVQAVASDMAALKDVIANTFKVKRYDLVHSSYALYYSPARLDVLDVMRTSLKPGGRCAVFTPNAPHGLVNLAARFSAIPDLVHDSLVFGVKVLEPYFRKNFAKCDVHHFNNVVSVPSSDVLLDFYRQTTYYDKNAETSLREVVDAEVAKTGSYKYEKNGYLIVGHA
jgi:ubiquinone/menaquinone biosynthesis C-methylase UbiE